MEGLERMISTVQDLGTRFGLNIIAAIVIFIVGGWAAKIIRRVIKRLMSRSGADPLLVSFGSTITYYAVKAFVVIAALNRLGIQTASFIAVLGAAGLAIGLALKSDNFLKLSIALGDTHGVSSGFRSIGINVG